MTISTLQNSITLLSTGASNLYEFPFVADSASDIAVIYTNSSGIQTTLPPSQYLVSINPPVTGQLWGQGGVVTTPLSGPPYAAGTSLTIQRIIPLLQETALSNLGNFYQEVVEEALDTTLMQIQQVSGRTGQLRGTWLTATLYNFGDIIVDGINGNNTGNLYVCAIGNTSGTWATDLANGDWSLALNIQSIIHATPNIANNQVYANISGSPAAPVGVGVSALIDSALGNVQGDILYRSGSAWSVLTPGTSGQVLQSGGAAANPSWATVAGSGTITGVTAGTGLSGGGTSGNVPIAFASIADKSILANISGGTATPGPTTLTSILDDIIGGTQGNLLYRGTTTWVALGHGTSGQVLQTGGAAANPSWVTALANGTTATTQSSSDNTTKVATTAFVKTAVSGGSLPNAFAIGTSVLGYDSMALHAPNDTISGSALTSVNVHGDATGDTLSGTWRAMATQITTAAVAAILWLRIA